MILKLFDESGQLVCSMSDNDSQLGNYSVHDYYTVHIIDLDPTTINFDNLEDIPKYRISEESYNARPNTFRRFKKEQMRNNPDFMKPKIPEDYLEDLAKQFQVGTRCRVIPQSVEGTVKYVGRVPQAQPGFYLGIDLDDPLGQNDGSVEGVYYFECPPSHGIFVRPNMAEVISGVNQEL